MRRSFRIAADSLICPARPISRIALTMESDNRNDFVIIPPRLPQASAL